MLVACPECNSRISDQADPCPQCGFPKAGHHSKEVREHSAQEYEARGVYLGAMICDIISALNTIKTNHIAGQL